MEVWKNHYYAVTWLKWTKAFPHMNKVFDQDIYTEFKGSKDDLIVQIVGVCSLIQSYIKKL